MAEATTNAGDDNAKDPDDAQDILESTGTKSSADEELIRLALHRSPYFTCLDEQQIQRFIQAAEVHTFQPGTSVITEGHRDAPIDEDTISDQEYLGSMEDEATYADIDDLLDCPPSNSGHTSRSSGGFGHTSGSYDRSENDNAGTASDGSSSGTSERAANSKSLLYIIREGRADVLYKTTKKASLGPGSMFGEGGFLYGRQHSASVVAGTPLECLTVDYQAFTNDVLPTDWLRQVFSHFADETDRDGNAYMRTDDLIQSWLTDSDDASTVQTDAGSVANMFHTILSHSSKSHRRNNQIYLSDFCLFHFLAAQPDPEIDIAFLLMDKRNKGAITRADFEAYLSNLPFFDRNSEFVQRHFGNGREIRFFQFSHFLLDLQKEMGRQAFLYRAKKKRRVGYMNDGAGYLSPEDFIDVLKRTSGWTLPDGIIRRLETLLDVQRPGIREASTTDREGALIAGTRYFAYVDFLTFQDLLNQLPGVCNLIQRSCEIKGDPVSPDDFKVANRVLGLGGRLSRRQVDIIFQLFDLDRDGFISGEDVARVCGRRYMRRVLGVGRTNSSRHPPQQFKGWQDRLKHPGDSNVDKPPEHIVGRALRRLGGFSLMYVAGALGLLAVYPLDLVKTRMMNQRVGHNRRRRYIHSFHCIQKTFANEGIIGFYRGLLPSLMAVGPQRVIMFSIYDLIHGLWLPENSGLNFHWQTEVIAGGCAGACQLLVANPLELVKIRLQLQGETKRIFKERRLPVPKFKSFSEIGATVGVSGFYKGAAACLLRDVTFGAIYFPVYAAIRDYLLNESNPLELSNLSSTFVAGTLAGIPAAMITTPADVIKTRLQVVPRLGEPGYYGIGDCVRKIYNKEGPTAFFKGTLFRVSRIAPQFGISLLAYEVLADFARKMGFQPLNSTANTTVSALDHPTFAASGRHKTKDIDKMVRHMGLSPEPRGR